MFLFILFKFAAFVSLILVTSKEEQTTRLLHTVYYLVTSAMPLFVYILSKVNSYIQFVSLFFHISDFVALH